MNSLIDQKNYFAQGHTLDLSFRIGQLKKLSLAIERYEDRISSALKKDLGKNQFEAYTTEIGFVLRDIRHSLKHIKKWSAPKKVSSSLALPFSRGKIYREPLGHVLIIAPWNYPFQLLFSPAIAALAAGNVVTLKPSELTPHTAEVVKCLVEDNFPHELIQVHIGGVDVSQALLKEPYDHILFTGSPRVGRIVMEAASRHLTPVTLELGGKSPCIVDKSANLEVAARRIVWGKTMNAGQTCVAPDYLLVHREVKAEFLNQLKIVLEKFFGPDAEHGVDYGRIVSKAHFNRLKGFIEQGDVFYGGRSIEDELFIEPTIIENVKNGATIMDEEIFGPILPVLTYESERELIETIGVHPNPLALYIFSENEKLNKKIVKEVAFGGGCINDTLVQVGLIDLPFGGRGASGMGAYHGERGFLSFSHEKSVVKTGTWYDPELRYPPHAKKLNMVKKFFKYQ